MTAQSFKPTSELTFDTVPCNMKRLSKWLRDENVTGICLDLHLVEQCDSAGLAFLIEAKRLCKQHQKTLKLEGMSKKIHSLAEFCGVDAML